MVFRAKAKKKKKKVKFAPVQAMSAKKARSARPLAPNRARPTADEIRDAGPNLMELLCLHFKDKGYGAKLATFSGTVPASLQLQVFLSDRAPFRQFGDEPVRVCFHLANRTVWYTYESLYGVKSAGRSFSMGKPEDPELISRMEGVVHVFMSGAKNLAKKMTDVVK